MVTYRADADTHRRLETMNRELQELRSQLDGDRSTARSESAFDRGPSPDQVVEEDDDYKMNVELVYLRDVLVETDLVTTAFGE